MKIQDIQVKDIERYFIMYRRYVKENKMTDDSDTLTVGDLIDFVENKILGGD